MQRVTYRPWGQRTALVLVMAVFLAIGSGLLVAGDVVGKRDWFGMMLSGVLILASVPGLWLAARLGVVVDNRGIRFRNFGRGRFVPWTEVTEASCVNYDQRGMPLYAPAVKLRGEQHPIVLSALGSYREETAQRRTDEIRSRVTATSGNSRQSA